MANVEQAQGASPAPAPAAETVSSPAAVATTSSITPEAAVVSSDATAVPVIATEASNVDIGSEDILGDSAAKSEEAKKADEEKKPEVDKADKGEKEADVKGEKKTEGEVKPDVKIESPVYEPFVLPETVDAEAAKESIDAFSKLLGEIEVSKLDHAGVQELGQKFIDLSVKATTDSVNRLNDYYVKLHEKTGNEWLNSFKNDPDLGGERVQETVANAREAVESYAGNEAQLAEFKDLMKSTNVGKHPALIRLIHNMNNKIKQYTTEADNGNGGNNRMVPAARPAPSKVKDYQRFYGSN